MTFDDHLPFKQDPDLGNACSDAMPPNPENSPHSGFSSSNSMSSDSTGRIYVETSVTGDTQKTWRFKIIFDLDNSSTKVSGILYFVPRQLTHYDKSVEIHAHSPSHVSITTAQNPLDATSITVLGEKRKKNEEEGDGILRKRFHHSDVADEEEEPPLESETEPEFDPSQARGALEDEISSPPPSTQVPRSRRSYK